jgi:hypothetical protein
VINHEPDREREQTKADARETTKAYRSIWSRLEEVRQTELYHDKLARKRAGITHPAKLYGRKQSDIDPAFEAAMQRLWDIGTLPEGRADTGVPLSLEPKRTLSPNLLRRSENDLSCFAHCCNHIHYIFVNDCTTISTC